MPRVGLANERDAPTCSLSVHAMSESFWLKVVKMHYRRDRISSSNNISVHKSYGKLKQLVVLEKQVCTAGETRFCRFKARRVESQNLSGREQNV